jgi:gamma-tubulin complex component 2
MIQEFQRNFDKQLGEFMSQLLADSSLQYNSHLSNLCVRLDYNGFYTNGAV